ncbi:ETC complex I subunit [Nitzschia inconspicua]|uniref:ETC complex I subunit n=1 Tax=Nitzschia inconspicua TaxID=303405 RepID=A0A9K3KWZ6_9STRA|nr:ETC complex I subunit [Nitzschia inconspicua]
MAFFSTELVPGVGFGKTSTGIVGLPVDPEACSKIVTKYQALLDRMAASDLPETAQYRVDVEKIARYRIKIATEHADDPDLVEELCQCGQVEELVQQADDEMMVLDMYLKERLWEEIDYDVDVEIEYNPDPSKDSEGLDDDEEEASPSK